MRKDAHYVGDIGDIEQANLLVVADYPTVSIAEPAGVPHPSFRDDGGIRLRSILDDLRKKHAAFTAVMPYLTYAVPCAEPTGWRDKAKLPKKSTTLDCSPLLRSKVVQLAERNKSLVIVALGATSLHALGIKFAKFGDVNGKLLQATIDGADVRVLATLSLRKLAEKAGLVNKFTRDLTHAFSLCADKESTLELDGPNYALADSLEDIKAIRDHILGLPEDWSLAVDTETNTLDVHLGVRILAVSISWGTGKACAIPLDHKDCPYPYEEAVALVRQILEGPQPKIFHNAKYDLKVFKKLGWSVENVSWCTLLGEHLIEEDKKGSYKLEALTDDYFKDFSGYKSSFQSGLVASNFESAPMTDMLEYAATDADLTRRLALLQVRRINAEDAAIDQRYARINKARGEKRRVTRTCKSKKALIALMRQELIPTTYALADMELHGVKVDFDYLNAVEQKVKERCVTLQSVLIGMVDVDALKTYMGKKFKELNVNSAPQLRAILYHVGYIDPNDRSKRIKYTATKRTTTNLEAVDKDTLNGFVVNDNSAFCKALLQYRAAVKAKNTYIVNIRNFSLADGRIHTNYHQNGTSTGRLSSSKINMQNTPKELAGQPVKKLFIPTCPNMVFLDMDASGAEIKVLAAYSRDKALIDALNGGKDIHSVFATKSYAPDLIGKGYTGDALVRRLAQYGMDLDHEWSYEDFVNRESLEDKAYGAALDTLRRNIKRVVFGIIYGAGDYKISKELGISIEDAADIISNLFSMFPGIHNYMKRTRWELNSFGMIETFFGRKRRFALKGASRHALRRAERQAINFNVQSTSSHIVMCTLCNLKPHLEEIGATPVLTVHDSIGMQLPRDSVPLIPDIVEEHAVRFASRAFPWLPVKFTWDYSVGPNYGEGTSIEEFLKK